jgi:hypothetical protein
VLPFNLVCIIYVRHAFSIGNKKAKSALVVERNILIFLKIPPLIILLKKYSKKTPKKKIRKTIMIKWIKNLNNCGNYRPLLPLLCKKNPKIITFSNNLMEFVKNVTFLGKMMGFNVMEIPNMCNVLHVRSILRIEMMII